MLQGIRISLTAIDFKLLFMHQGKELGRYYAKYNIPCSGGMLDLGVVQGCYGVSILRDVWLAKLLPYISSVRSNYICLVHNIH